MKLHLKTALACFGVAGLVTIAAAQPINGTLSLSVRGVTANNQDSSVSTSLNVNDIFTYTPFKGPINTIVSGATGDFSALSLWTPPTFVTQSTLNLDDLTAYNWTSSFGTFQASNLKIGATSYTPSVFLYTNPVNQTVLSVFEYGVFTPAGVLSSYGPANMAETISFTQTVINGSMSFSASAATMSPVPEPSSLVPMGLGLLGLMGLRRRRRPIV